ncbi:hypothetical protein [Chitiniphilus eburneus]|uniref:hypothetical protein n=1 Tax=Chitiniphilus eburneus TaxID=2571148 RepID=UPI0035D06DE7
MTNTSNTRPVTRAELCTIATARYDAANIAHRYASMVATTLNVITRLHKDGDPLLGPMLDVVGWLAEDAEHCLTNEVDEAQIRMNELRIAQA